MPDNSIDSGYLKDPNNYLPDRIDKGVGLAIAMVVVIVIIVYVTSMK